MVDAMVDSEALKPTNTERVVLESWSEGFMIGALVIMCGITLANMRSGVLLHKLILIELILAVPNGFFMFFNPPTWGWFLSSTVVPLITSWSLHNVIAWMKNKPFLGRRGRLIYIVSVLLVQPYWVLEIYANFAFFNGTHNPMFVSTRPFEAVFRDPWWIFTIGNLFWNMKFQYDLSLAEIVRASPRFGILLGCMGLSVICIVVDLLSVTPVIPIGVVNPFWRFAFVFKCFTDSIILDDFKTALDKLSQHSLSRILPVSIPDDATSTQVSTSTQGSTSTQVSDAIQGGRRSPGKNERSLDATVTEIEHIRLSDAGGRPVAVSHVEGQHR